MSARPIMIMAGGTGGHVFPALAVAEVLAKRNIPVIWLGTPNGLEARVVPAAGIAMETLHVRGLRGNGVLGWLKAPWMIIAALGQAMGAMRRHKPRAVLGMGGYVAGPGGLAARLLGYPLIIHEQNAIAGLTNRLLSRLARGVLTGLDASFPRGTTTRFTGNPVRLGIAQSKSAAQRYAARTGPIRLLVMGGSLGALSLNQHIPAALAQIPERQRPQVLHQAGPKTFAQAQKAYAQAGVNADVVAFIEDVATAYAECDLAICRSGALTVSELAAAGVPALLVPFPYAVDDHQTANAGFLVNAGAAEMISNADLAKPWFVKRLTELLADRSRLAQMADAAQHVGRPDAADRVADYCLEVAA